MNNQHPCLYKPKDTISIYFVVFTKLKGKIPWLWMSIESFRGIYTSMSDV